jgi:hypothetical protein
VPEHCPACGSQRLSPERGYRKDFPDVTWERPTCGKCGWAGEPVPIGNVVEPKGSAAPEGECIIPTIPLRQLKRPKPGTKKLKATRPAPAASRKPKKKR